MTKDDIIRMARDSDSGFDGGADADGTMTDSLVGIAAIIRFAELVAAAEREACAKLCDAIADGWENNPGTNPLAGYIASSNCAVEIRARSSK